MRCALIFQNTSKQSYVPPNYEHAGTIGKHVSAYLHACIYFLSMDAKHGHTAVLPHAKATVRNIR